MSWTRLDVITATILERVRVAVEPQAELFPDAVLPSVMLICDQCGCEFKASFSLSLCERCLVKGGER